jgi:prepilin-type N-terminal cleavage/methylation domain-containing protein
MKVSRLKALSSGLTLVELIIAIAILMILSGNPAACG